MERFWIVRDWDVSNYVLHFLSDHHHPSARFFPPPEKTLLLFHQLYPPHWILDQNFIYKTILFVVTLDKIEMDGNVASI